MAKRRKSRKHSKKTSHKKPSYKVVCGKQVVRSRMRKLSTAKKVRTRAAKSHDKSCRVVKC